MSQRAAFRRFTQRNFIERLISQNDIDRWEILNRATQERRIADAFLTFRSFGIEPILFKGWAVGRFYPQEKPRLWADIDLAVSPADHERAAELVASGDNSLAAVDLHRGFRHFDVRPWEALYSASELARAGDIDFRIPRAEDHLRLVCAHWLNDGGADRERLWDVYYMISNRPAAFDWDYCLNACGQERRSWTVSSIGAARHFLNLDIDDLPIRDEISALPKWVQATLEREWAYGGRLVPLATSSNNKKLFWRELRRRIPPNPIQASVELQNSLGNRPRRFDQIRTLFRRLVPSLAKYGRRLIGGLSRP